MASSPESRIAATTLSEEDCQRILAMLHGGRSPDNAANTGRFRELHAEIDTRDQHFYATQKAAPKFDAPFEKAQTFQTDAIRRTYARGRSRILEHAPIFHVTPAKDEQKWRDAAVAIQEYFKNGLREVEERSGFRIQGHLYHGQSLHCFGVLHWREFLDGQPEMPDPEEYNEPPSDPDRFDETDGKYTEKATSVLERFKRMKADAPFPWWFDVPRSDTVGFVEDRSLYNGLGIFTSIETIGFLAYKDQLASRDKITLSLNESKTELKVFQEHDAPGAGDPSGDTKYWGDLRVGHVWTRNEGYELASMGTGRWTLVKSFKHRYGIAPFVLAKAMETNHPDPLYRWQPWLLGMFRTKPQYDYERSLGRLLAEQTAIPRYWIELSPGTFMIDDRGNRMVFSDNAAIAQMLPEGAKLVKADVELSPAYVQFLTASKEDVSNATPETGFVDVGAETQPHTILMAQTQSNTEIADLKQEQARALRIAFQTILTCMANTADEDGTPVYVKGKSGKIVEIPTDIARGLVVEVAIQPNSGAQEVARNEYLRGLLNDPNAMMTVRKYLEETGDEHPDETIQSWAAEQAEFQVMPQIVQQEIAKKFGDAYVLTPGGSAVDSTGKPTSPWDVLAKHGFAKAPQAAPWAAPGTVPLPATPSPLQPMNAPNTNGAVMQ